MRKDRVPRGVRRAITAKGPLRNLLPGEFRIAFELPVPVPSKTGPAAAAAGGSRMRPAETAGPDAGSGETGEKRRWKTGPGFPGQNRIPYASKKKPRTDKTDIRPDGARAGNGLNPSEEKIAFGGKLRSAFERRRMEMKKQARIVSRTGKRIAESGRAKESDRNSMILSVSRRTDIPAFYSKWFMNRIREGYVMVRNPMNYHQVSRISLSNEGVDCIVFWTKNAKPLLTDIDEIAEKYPFYFQYTLNGYGKDIEPYLPDWEQRTDVFLQLSGKIGRRRILWRYDPVLLTDSYTVDWHIRRFRETAEKLNGYTDTCVFSFVDMYDKIKSNVRNLNLRTCDASEMNRVAEAFAQIAGENGMTLQTCAEAIDLDRYGIRHGCCIDGGLIEELTGCRLKAKKDKNQREECGCLESVDIGQYNTCRHGCRYCYANFNPQSVATFSKQHDPASPFLIGGPEAADKVTERKMKTLLEGASGQMSLFDL